MVIYPMGNAKADLQVIDMNHDQVVRIVNTLLLMVMWAVVGFNFDHIRKHADV